MSNLGFKSTVFHGEVYLGEVEVLPTRNEEFRFPNNEIRINQISPPSERCHPLSVLLTLSPFAVRCKLKPDSPSEHSPLIRLIISCLQEFKTAMVMLGNEELHLVAMPSRQEKFPCLWCCSVPKGLYGTCLGLLNIRCLAVVFDLDETLIVANTMKSFEDKIEALQRRISCENDPIRVSGMAAELKRYIEDRLLLKDYLESDTVVDNGKLYKVQHEEVPSPANENERIFRPVIRLKERNTVLTRINPEIRDTSVLVKLRPSWEDLRNYLTAKGRKRFEVYVCTMAERDYALEMWRLLDPEAHLINLNQLFDRVVCVNSGARKSLLNVFQGGICHPKMALVIDDRLKVWEDMDQPRVHVVSPFTPYCFPQADVYCPQADTTSTIPVLCVARNVACNVRAGFFREFDENLLRRIFELCFENDVANLPFAPDVSDYLISEDASFVPNGIRDIPVSEGMSSTEVERRLNKLDEKHIVGPIIPDLKPGTSQPSVAVFPTFFPPGTARTSFPVHKPCFPEVSAGLDVNTFELNPDARRRHMIQAGQGVREQTSGGPPLFAKLPKEVATPLVQACGGWLVEEDSIVEQHNAAGGHVQKAEASQDQQQAHLPNHSVGSYIPSGTPSHASQLKTEEAYHGSEWKKQHTLQSYQPLARGDITVNEASNGNGVLQNEAGKVNLLPPFIYIGVLQEIGRRCGSKVEFRSVVSTSKDLQFSVEVLFTGEKVGAGMGKTKKDAQQQAAKNALQCLADKYVSYIALRAGSVDRHLDKIPPGNENGFLWDIVDPGAEELSAKEDMHDASTSETSGDASRGSESFGSQQTEKRPSSPRSPHTYSAKRLKEELLSGLQVSSSQ